MTTTNKQAASTGYTTLTVTSLTSLANSQTAGWQSALINNVTNQALDYQLWFSIPMASTAAANDKALHIYLCGAAYGGSSWYYSDGGTGTLPSGSQGTYTTNAPNPTGLKYLGDLPYYTTGMTCQGLFLATTAFGQYLPDGFSIIINNYTGAAVGSSNVVVAYTPIFTTNG